MVSIRQLLLCGLAIFGTIGFAQPNFKVLHTFSGPDGNGPGSPQLLASDGLIYGVTKTAGDNGFGNLYRVAKDGSGFTIIHSFTKGADGGVPNGSLVEGAGGLIYGVTNQGGSANQGTVFCFSKPGSQFKTVFAFPSDSLGTPGRIIQLPDGRLCVSRTQGICRFKVDGTGYEVLHSFDSNLEGYNPHGFLIGSDGTMYGCNNFGGQGRAGTVFSLGSNGTFKVLHAFEYTDGAFPDSLLLSSDGALYGTTKQSTHAPLGGVIFRLTTNGATFALMDDFQSQGLFPTGALSRDTDGSFYLCAGVTGLTADNSVYKITSSGTILLHSLGNGFASVNLAADGNLYGAAQNTVFSHSRDADLRATFSLPHKYAAPGTLVNIVPKLLVGGSPFPGQKIEVNVLTNVGNPVTDALGTTLVSLNIPWFWPRADILYQVVYKGGLTESGDAVFPITSYGILTILSNTSLIAGHATGAPGQTLSLLAILKEDDGPVGGEALQFYLADKFLGTGTTDALGKVTLTFAAPGQPGTYKVTVKYLGNNATGFAPSVTNSSITVVLANGANFGGSR